VLVVVPSDNATGRSVWLSLGGERTTLARGASRPCANPPAASTTERQLPHRGEGAVRSHRRLGLLPRVEAAV
jgi:hypothetical protein